MKKLYILLFCMFTFVVAFAQRTVNPQIENQKAKHIILSSVLLTEQDTFVELDLSEGLGGFWDRYVVFIPETYLKYIDPITNQEKTLRVKSVVRESDFSIFRFGVRIYKEFFEGDRAKVLYLFDPIPENVDLISFEEKGGWKIKGIHITPRESLHFFMSHEMLDSLMHAPSYYNDLFAGEYAGMDKKYQSRYVMCPVDNDDSPRVYALVNTFSENSEGEMEKIAMFEETSDKNILVGVLTNGDVEGCYATLTEEGKILKILKQNSDDEFRFLRLATPNISKISENTWTGTAFAVGKNLLVTNYHVVENANQISIFGINSDFSQSYKANILASDKVNDLALLRIVDNGFNDIGNTPYSFRTVTADVGENVYVLGYPLTATMGEEIKLTNGIVSAKTGYEGNVSQYQISAPVQPGNSGGPLIDNNGNVIGVICAKHSEAENVTYAVKMSQVSNLIESVSDISILNKANRLQGKSLQEQVKLVRKYIYIVKCSD